jgi:hypothetical protein
VSIRKLKEIHALTHPADRATDKHRQSDNDDTDTESLFTTLAAEAKAELSDPPESADGA